MCEGLRPVLLIIPDPAPLALQVLPARRQLKSLKTCGVSSNWCVFSSELSYLLVSTGTLGNTLQPFSFRAGTMTKLAKFDGEMDYSWCSYCWVLICALSDVLDTDSLQMS